MKDNLLNYSYMKKVLKQFKGNEDVKENDIINAYNNEAGTSLASYDFNTPFEDLLNIATYYNHEIYLRNKVYNELCDENFTGAKQLIKILENYCNHKDFKYYKPDNESNTPLTYNDLLEKIKEKYG